MKRFLAACLMIVSAVGIAMSDTGSTDAYLYFITPQDGQMGTNPVTIRFGLRGMGIAPAGHPIPNTGHHHLIIDSPLPDINAAIPNDTHHRHFGQGQTETVLNLQPGWHTLQLLLGDASHIPHKPAIVSQRIAIFVAPNGFVQAPFSHP